MEWVTAAATVVLAILTGIYVWETRRIAKQAAASAEAAREAADQATRAADSSERGVLIESMPLVIPRHGGGSTKAWKLAASNHGRSVALSVLVEMYDGNHQVGYIVKDALPPDGEAWAASIGPEASANAFELRQREHRLEAWYVNAFGQQFRTVRTVEFIDGEPIWEFHTDVREGHSDDWRRLY